MNKKITSIAVLLGSFCITGVVSASFVTINNPLNTDSMSVLICKIATGIGTLIASLGVVMVLVSGILYLVSAGDPGKMGTAKKALIYAIAGIVIGIIANVLVNEVLKIIGSGATTC